MIDRSFVVAVALLGGAARPPRGGRLADGGVDTSDASRRLHLGQGRGPESDRVVQGARHVDGGFGGRRPRRADASSPLRPGTPRARLPRMAPQPAWRCWWRCPRTLHGPSSRSAASTEHRWSSSRGPSPTRDVGLAEQPVARRLRPVDSEGAIPRRGQEDDGLRALGAVRRRPARRDRLPDRRRDGPGRDVEGLRRDGDHGMDRPGAPRLVSVQSDGCAPVVEGFQNDRPSHPSPGPTPGPPHTGFECPTPSPVSSVSAPFVRRTAPRSPSPKPTSFRPLRRCRRPPVWTLAPRQGRRGPRWGFSEIRAGSKARGPRARVQHRHRNQVPLREPQRPSVRGSRTSRKPSPTRLNESAHRNTIRPGNVEVHHRPAMMSAWPSLTRVPHSA